VHPVRDQNPVNNQRERELVGEIATTVHWFAAAYGDKWNCRQEQQRDDQQ
jgi:hypothetical protein